MQLRVSRLYLRIRIRKDDSRLAHRSALRAHERNHPVRGTRYLPPDGEGAPLVEEESTSGLPGPGRLARPSDAGMANCGRADPRTGESHEVRDSHSGRGNPSERGSPSRIAGPLSPRVFRGRAAPIALGQGADSAPETHRAG